MKDTKLYERILGLSAPWYVNDISLDISGNEITVEVAHRAGHRFECPECGKKCGIHDHRLRRWRHLPTCQLHTIIQANIPRVDCKEHGVLQIAVPWAERNSSLTALFERLVIDWLQEASQTAVARLLGLSWDQVDTVRKHAVERGLLRRQQQPHENVCVDETSFQKRHEYVTVVTDSDTGCVLEVLDDKKKQPLSEYFADNKAYFDSVKTISMDMSKAFIGAVQDNFPHWEDIICFDKFHVSQYFCDALGKVRYQEHRQLNKIDGNSVLNRTRFDWLRNSDVFDNRGRRWFMDLTRSNLKTARAWAIKETASKLWDYSSVAWAQKGWKRLLGWVSRCRLKPVIAVGKTIRNHLWGIINATKYKVTNAKAEGINSKIQALKKRACGYRNRQRFREAILFHLGGLNLYP